MSLDSLVVDNDSPFVSTDLSEPLSSDTLIVDLDGCLLSTDLLYESMVNVIFRKPWIIFLLPIWLLKGKAYIKQKLATMSVIDIEALPYNYELISYLEEQKKTGRKIILCTGSWYTYAQQIRSKFDFISEYFGSTEGINLTGQIKAKLLLERYGQGNFSYVGNERKDLEIWRWAKNGIIISSTEKLAKQAGLLCKVERTFTASKPSLMVILKAIRLHQWVKNLLIFVPLATAHQFNNYQLLLDCFLAFLAFSLCASATYLINDLADLQLDRKHETKSKRPFAAGLISIKAGLSLCLIIFIGAGSLCLFLPDWFFACLCLYVVVTVTYSFKLKKLQTIDITTLAGLYTLRILAGGAAVSIQPSFWLLAFSMFVFFCLAIVKRISEIHRSKCYEKNAKIAGRGYYAPDMGVLLSLASSSGLLSIFVFAMYINSQDVILLYDNPILLWFICPVFGYWIVRVLIMASRGEIDEDPIVFAINDWRSWITGFVIMVIVMFARYWQYIVSL